MGRRFVGFEEFSDGKAAVAKLRLSGGVTIRFTHWYESDREDFEVETTA